jgi:glycerate dehydrogenase
MKIVFLDALTLGDVNFEKFKELGEVLIYQTTSYNETLERIYDPVIVF